MTERTGFRFGFRVRYSEVDFQGIVYFAHYATYFDVAIHEFFRALPYDYTVIRNTTGTDFNIVRAVVEYQRPLRFDEAFAVEVGLGRIGRTSLTFTPAIWVASEAEPRATGEVVWVHADQASMRAVPLRRSCWSYSNPAAACGRADERLGLLQDRGFASFDPWPPLPPSA